MSVAFVNLVKYFLTISPSFCLQPMNECESPFYFWNCMKFVRGRYFSCPKLYMLHGHSLLNHVPALSSKVVGKNMH